MLCGFHSVHELWLNHCNIYSKTEDGSAFVWPEKHDVSEVMPQDTSILARRGKMKSPASSAGYNIY
jgi:hypothetical protein